MPQLRSGRELLECRSCGAMFPEATATDDGWTYICPEDGCEASGLGEALRHVN